MPTIATTCVSTMLRPARVLRRASALVVVTVVALCFPARHAHAQTLSTPATVTTNVTTAVAGSAPTAVTVGTSTMSYTIGNTTTYNIQAKLAAALPTGVTLQISVTAPTGTTTLGLKTLTTTYQDLTGVIPKNGTGTVTITHRLSATSAAGVISARSVSVNYRLF